jgi:hypothetical protein
VFWTSLSLDELVAQQQVAPIEDFGELDWIWSEGDVLDDALSEVLQDRAKRRHRGRWSARPLWHRNGEGRR